MSFNGGKITDCSSDEGDLPENTAARLCRNCSLWQRKLDIGLLSYDEDNNIITGMHYDEYIDVEKEYQSSAGETDGKGRGLWIFH